MTRLLLPLALLATLAASGMASAQTSVRDSVRMEIKIYEHYFDVPTGVRCQIGIYAVWPNVLQDILGSPDRTYGYGDYGRVATEGMSIPSGGEFLQENTVEAVIPNGFIGHNPSIGGSAGISSNGVETCSPLNAVVASFASGGWRLLSGRPFRITDWYATYTLPDGTPIALFEWEPADALQIAFDASFESEQSREIDASAPANKVPVASYGWDFGDGASGSGAKPVHEYDEPGDYDVRLTVTDDDGETASRTVTVTVDGVFLRTEIEFATDEVAEGDTLTVRGTVTNGGTETIFAVSAERLFLWGSRVDPALNLSGSLTNAPALTALPLSTDEEMVVTASSLGPGESIEVTRDYVVGRLGQYRASSESSYRPVDTFVDWQVIVGVEGETPEIDAVPVRHPCREADPACATTLVSSPEYFITLVSGSGPSARTGLVPGAQIEEVRFVDFATVDGGVRPVCQSGCADFVALVRDEEDQPADDIEIEFIVDQTGPMPFADAAGGFVCERVLIGESGTCVAAGQPLKVRTDAEGFARVWIALKAGPPEAESATVEAQARPATAQGDTAMEEIPLNQSVIFREDGHSVSDASAIFAGGSHAVSAVAGAVSIGNWCESFVNWTRDQALDAVGAARYGRNLILLSGGSVVGPWVCSIGVDVVGITSPVGAALAVVDGVADGAKKFADLFQFTWFAQEYGIDKASDLVVLQAPLPPPFLAWVQGDAIDTAGDIAGFGFSQGFTTSSHEVVLQETSGLSRPSGATSRSDFDPSRYDGLLRIQWMAPGVNGNAEVEAFATFGYTPVQSDLVSIGSEGFLVANASLTDGAARIAGRRGSTEESARVGISVEDAEAGDTSILVGAWSGEVGEYVVIGEGTDTPEIAQVLSMETTGPPSEPQTSLALTAGLRYNQGAGIAVERLASGVIEPPAPPVLRPHQSDAPPETLAWASYPTTLASQYDVQVASDTTAAGLTLLIDAQAVLEDSLATDPAQFDLDTEYHWRVRTTNEVGAGAWSRWQAFSPVHGVASEPGVPETPAVLALSAPAPNPTSGMVRLGYALPVSGLVRLSIYDALGREVSRLVDAEGQAGTQEVPFDTAALAPGVYIVRLSAGDNAMTQTLTVVR